MSRSCFFGSYSCDSAVSGVSVERSSCSRVRHNVVAPGWRNYRFSSFRFPFGSRATPLPSPQPYTPELVFRDESADTANSPIGGTRVRPSRGIPLVCLHPYRAVVSRTFHPHCCVLFIFPSRYMVRYRSQSIFRLAGFVPGVFTPIHQWTLLFCGLCLHAFLYGPITLLGTTFQTSSSGASATNRTHISRRIQVGLFRFRSPLLAESLLFSFPAITMMLRFKALPCRINPAFSDGSEKEVSLGDPGIEAYSRLPRDYRSLSRPSSVN